MNPATPATGNAVRRGIYSIGTNSTRALVAELNSDPPHLLAQLSIGTRLGEGLKERGHLNEGAIERTVEALRAHRKKVEPLTNDVVAIATSAVRRADNADIFADGVRKATDAELTVIDGEEEAACSFAGAVAVSPHEEGVRRYGVVDTGGGSTEYAAGSRDRSERAVSCEVGAVRLSDEVQQLTGTGGPVPSEALERARSIAREKLRPMGEFSKVDRLIFVGGTATTTMSILNAPHANEETSWIALDDLRRVIGLLASKNLQERREIPGMNPQRADILLAGALLLETAFEFADQDRALIASGDLLLGYLLRHPH